MIKTCFIHYCLQVAHDHHMAHYTEMKHSMQSDGKFDNFSINLITYHDNGLFYKSSNPCVHMLHTIVQ